MLAERDLAVGSDGAVYLLDRYAAQVVVLRPDGSFLRSFGQVGGGPGEFSAQSLSDLILSDSSVLVPDLQRQRLLEFGFDGSYTGARPFPVQGYALEWATDTSGTLLHRVFALNGDFLVRWRSGGGVDTLFAFEPMGSRPTEVLPPAPIWALDDSAVLVGRSDASVIRRFAGDQIQSVIRLNEDARPLEEREVEILDSILMAFVRQADPGAISEQVLAQITYPDKAPVLSGLMKSPQGKIWIRLAGTAEDMGAEALRVGTAAGYGGDHWIVLDSSDLPSRRVTMPRRFVPYQFFGEWLYGIQTDDFGVQHARRVAWK